jgi:exosortase F-associated protein
MKRYILLGFALLALVLIYLFQRVSYADILNSILPEILEIRNPNPVFIFNRVLRLILNDAACMVIIWAVFQQTKFLRAAFLVFVVELLIILPLYFAIKLSLEGDSELSSPFLSQIHRIIVNPLLMFLLMIGFLYQKLNPNPSPRGEG